MAESERERLGTPARSVPRAGKVLRDGHGRVIDYLRVSVTDRCNSRCLYCMPREGVHFLEPARILRYEEILALADVFIGLGIRKIRITGGEPLIRRNVLFLIGELGKLEGLGELVITTNGIRLAEHAERLAAAGVRRVNVSLDTLKRETFRLITGKDALDRVLEGVEQALRARLQVKINVVAMRGVNDGEFPGFVDYAAERGTPVRFIELMPQRYNRRFAWKLFIPAGRVLELIGAKHRLEPLSFEPGDAESGLYRIAGAGGTVTVGLISPMSDPFCRQCNRVRLTADGTLKTCLFGPDGPNLKALLESGASKGELEEAILGAVQAKPGSLAGGADSGPVMHRLGG